MSYLSSAPEPLIPNPGTPGPSYPNPTAGLIGFAIGAAAILLVLVHFWAGPFAPQPDVGVSIGELAGEIRDSAARALSGAEQPSAESAPWDIDRILKLVAAILAGTAIVLGLFAFVRGETWRPAAGAIALGASAMVFQVFVWVVVVFLCFLVAIAFIHMLGGMLSG